MWRSMARCQSREASQGELPFTQEKFSSAARPALSSDPILTAWQRNWTRMASPSHLLTLIFTVRHRACRPILCMKRETLIISSSLEEPSIPATRNLRPHAISRCVSPAADSSRQPSTPCALKALPSSAIVRLWSLGSGIPWFYANWIAFFRLLPKVVGRKISENLNLATNQYTLNFRIYGRNGKLAEEEPETRSDV